MKGYLIYYGIFMVGFLVGWLVCCLFVNPREDK